MYHVNTAGNARVLQSRPRTISVNLKVEGARTVRVVRAGIRFTF